jgi:excisionase family DNA binding protein
MGGGQPGLEAAPALLDVKEVARRLRVSDKTVYELIWRGEIRCYRVRRRYRFSQEQVREFLERTLDDWDG